MYEALAYAAESILWNSLSMIGYPQPKLPTMPGDSGHDYARDPAAWIRKEQERYILEGGRPQP